MDITHVQEISIERAKKWHTGGIADWSALEWAGCMAGEAGEAANFAKKLKRIDDQIKNIESGVVNTNVEEIKRKVAKEVADTILYGVLVAAKVGYVGKDFEDIIKKVFNDKSFEYGFPERL